MSKINRLLTFHDLLECGQLSLAAKKRSVTKAAICKQMALLEKECGLSLISSSSNLVFPTKAGMALYEKTREIHTTLLEINSFFRHYKETPKGRLRVFTSISFASEFLLPKLKLWFEENRDVKLELTIEDNIPDIVQKNYDIVLGTRFPGPSTAIQQTLFKMRFYLCASPHYIEKYGLPKSLNDLQNHLYISHQARRSKSGDYILTVGKQSITLKPILYLNNLRGLVQLATQGMGIIKAAKISLADHLEKGELVELLPNLFDKSWFPIYLYYKETKHLAPTVQSFIQFVKKCVEDE